MSSARTNNGNGNGGSNGGTGSGNNHFSTRSELPSNVTAAIAAAMATAGAVPPPQPLVATSNSSDGNADANTASAAGTANAAAHANKDVLALTDFLSKAQLRQFTLPLMQAGISSVSVLEVDHDMSTNCDAGLSNCAPFVVHSHAFVFFLNTCIDCRH